MITETNAVNFRQNLGEMLNQVQYRHDSVMINKDGKPVAVLIDARLFERIRRMQGRFDALCQRIEAGFSQVPESTGMAEIEAAVAQERRESSISELSSILVYERVLTYLRRRPVGPPAGFHWPAIHP